MSPYEAHYLNLTTEQLTWLRPKEEELIQSRSSVPVYVAAEAEPPVADTTPPSVWIYTTLSITLLTSCN